MVRPSFHVIQQNSMTYGGCKLICDVRLHAMKLLGKPWRRNDTRVHVIGVHMPGWAIRSMLQATLHHTDINIATLSTHHRHSQNASIVLTCIVLYELASTHVIRQTADMDGFHV